MPITTGFDFADTVLVPFPFTDHTVTKRRPAVVVSSCAYHQERQDLVLMAITSQLRSVAAFGEVVIHELQKAGLLKPGVIKPLIATLEKRLVLRELGRLEHEDRRKLRAALQQILGEL